MEPLETMYVKDRTVSCNGGDNALGHPIVYLNLGDGGTIDCPYCGQRFIIESTATDTPAS